MVDNEIGFVRAVEFRQMAPAIVRMEIRRLGRMIASFDRATDRHNALVRARYELRRFVDRLEEIAGPDAADAAGRPAESDPNEEVAGDPGQALLPHLEAAMLTLSLDEEVTDGERPEEGPPSGREAPEASSPATSELAPGGPAAAEEIGDPAERVRRSQESVAYVLDRLRYVHERLHLLY